jgi:hypothetical protein
MRIQHHLSASLTVLVFSAIAFDVGAQTGATPSSPSVTAPAGTANPATPPHNVAPAPQPMGSQGIAPSAASSDARVRLTPEQMREYVSARNACGAPSEQTQACNDAVHRRFTGVDPKCQTAFGSALTDCLQNSGKGK